MTTLSQAYGEHQIHLRHIIPLDFHAVRSVPDTHVWHKSDDLFSLVDDDDEDDDRLSSSIPVVDLKDPNVVKQAGHACEAWGAFQVVNHGIPLNLLAEVEEEARRLFSLPTQQKMKALREPAGATGYGLARISPFFPKYMWHEGFTIMGSPVEHARALWPDDVSARFCDVIERYEKEMKVLAEKLTSVILNSLNVSLEDLKLEVMSGSTSTSTSTSTSAFTAALQLNSYPSCPDPTLAMGLAPHTDTSLLTILHQTAIAGLQIFKQGAGWLWVPPLHGALVVNVGDLLHVLSNARFPSVLHRAAVNPHGRHRFSVAYFYGLPTDCDVAPLPKVLNGYGQTPIYRSIKVKQYVINKSKNFEQALSLIRI